MDFVKKIRDEIEQISLEENLDKNKAFIIWVLERFYALPREQAINVMTDSGGDKRVDAFLESEETLTIIQCKLFESDTKQIGEKEISVFKGCIDWLKQPEEIQKLNLSKLLDASITFAEKWAEGANAELHYFALGRFDANANHERRVFNNAEPSDRRQMYFHDLNDIINVYQANLQMVNPLSSECVSFNLKKGEFFLRQEGSFPAVVLSLKGSDLANLYDRFGDRLFERNIRLFRGIRKGSINAGIKNTALDEAERRKFWYYNNGVSFVCLDFSFDNEADPSKVTVEGPQIINGCQTTVCLQEAKKALEDPAGISEDIDLLARFIKAPLEDVEFITLFTNSQNPVSVAQLKSNDPLQNRLKTDFEKYTPPYFYSIKEGDWQTLSTGEKKIYESRVINMINAAQAVYSFLKDPAFARRYRIELFSKKYHEIFRHDMKVEEILLPWRVLESINSEIAKYRRQEYNTLKSNPLAFSQEQTNNILRKEFLLYSDLMILYFVQKLIHKRYNDYTPKIAAALLNQKLQDRVKALFDYIAAVLSFSEKLTKERNLPRFLKNIENIDSLYAEVEKEVEKDKAIKKDILKDILPNL